VSAFGTEVSSVGLGLESLSLNNDFTPSTPYVHKFRTEMCKNFQLYGTCKYGDECSFAHGRTHMMIKNDVSNLYKTKLCKKYSTNGYCPYGMRCQFIHDMSETRPDEVPQQQAPIDTKIKSGGMKATATVFVPKTRIDANLKVEAKEFKFVPIKKVPETPANIEASISAPTTTGGFGNK